MAYLLNLVYCATLLLASPWLLWSARKGKYRAGHAAKLLGWTPRREGSRPCVWFHAVSAGEASLLEPLIRQIRQSHPEWECVVSTTTNTGFEMARRKYPDLTVFYCPLDFSWATRAAMRRIRPDLLVLAELELWPNMILAARAHGARVAVVNGRLSERSARGYRRVRWLVAWMLRRVDGIAAQTDDYARRFQDLGARPDSVRVTGSLKFDGARGDRSDPRVRQLRQLAGIEERDVVFLAGSTQHPEEELAIQAYRRLAPEFPQLRLLLAPRHPARANEVARHLDAAGLNWQRRSELTGTATARVLLIDVMGELSAWWGVATLGFVGGSMGSRGGQNMIEPAAYGVAVSFGPRTHNFRDVVRLLLDGDAARVVNDGDEVTRFVRRCLERPADAEALGTRARECVARQLGATARTLEMLAQWMPSSATDRRAA